MTNTLWFQNAVLELRRGVILIAVLTQLSTQKYGYALLKSLAEKGFELDQGTLYPLLRRLESQDLLDSSWKIEEGRPRRYYVINAEGKRALARLSKEWAGLVTTMDGILSTDRRQK